MRPRLLCVELLIGLNSIAKARRSTAPPPVCHHRRSPQLNIAETAPHTSRNSICVCVCWHYGRRRPTSARASASSLSPIICTGKPTITCGLLIFISVACRVSLPQDTATVAAATAAVAAAQSTARKCGNCVQVIPGHRHRHRHQKQQQQQRREKHNRSS